MKALRILAWPCCILCSTICLSQNISTPSFSEELLKGRVKQMDEFMCRFNMTETWDGQKISNRNDTAYRKKYLTTLFDGNKFRLDGGKLTNIAAEFVNEVARNDFQIHYEDSTWIAEVECTAQIGNLHKKIKLYMHTQETKPHEYKWVISHVFGDIFNLSSQNNQTDTFISPMEHEIGFVGLLTLPMNAESVPGYMDCNYTANQLSMLAVLLANKLLRLKTVDKVQFHFYTIPGYAFTVERIERKNSFNTGWLISKLSKLNQ